MSNQFLSTRFISEAELTAAGMNHQGRKVSCLFYILCHLGLRVYSALNPGETPLLQPRPCPPASRPLLRCSLSLIDSLLEATLEAMKSTSLFHKWENGDAERWILLFFVTVGMLFNFMFLSPREKVSFQHFWEKKKKCSF